MSSSSFMRSQTSNGLGFFTGNLAVTVKLRLSGDMSSYPTVEKSEPAACKACSCHVCGRGPLVFKRTDAANYGT